MSSTTSALPFGLAAAAPPDGGALPQEAEREAIEQALLLTQWNRKHAARVLGVSYKTLLQKIRECELTP